MTVVLSVTWATLPEHEAAVRHALIELSRATRTEAGNLCYHVYTNPAESGVFRIFEMYTDEEAFAAHVGSAHFQKWALDTAVPLLESRLREDVQLLEDE